MAANYRILTQHQVLDGVPGAPLVASMEITFESLPSQSYGSIRVPLSQYGPSEVDALIEPLATKMEAVAGL